MIKRNILTGDDENFFVTDDYLNGLHNPPVKKVTHRKTGLSTHVTQNENVSAAKLRILAYIQFNEEHLE